MKESSETSSPEAIEVRGARVHNLKGIDVDIPLGRITGIAGVSGSGKSSLALGILYAEGSRRYLEALSTYTRRRMTQAARADVESVRYVPAALALRQRPGVPGIRSTFGTMTELLNSLRLMFSRLASHRCPNGHYAPPTLSVAAETKLLCPVCGEPVVLPGAEDLAFNSGGACPSCGGTGTIREVDEATLVPDESLTIDEGAVAPWQTLMWALMKDVAREMGVRTDVPYRDLTAEEKEIVLHGPVEKKHILYHNPKTGVSGELDFTYYSAVHTVKNALAKVKDEKGMKRVERFLKTAPCPACHGTRLSEAARAPRVRGISLADATAMTLTELSSWVAGVPATLPEPMQEMARSICASFAVGAKRLMDLGLGYLALDRAASTLSTGERQRTQLARAVRNQTTGVLYVLDEPSIGLHPANLRGLTHVMDELEADGNTVVVVDHDVEILAHADHILELGPGAGAAGGQVLAEGSVAEVRQSPASVIAPYLPGAAAHEEIRQRAGTAELFAEGRISLATRPLHTVHALRVEVPLHRLTAVTGVSGSGKTTLVLESLVPALSAALKGEALPAHIESLDAGGITTVKLIDATPIGANVRSTVATYAGIHDELRKVYARTKDAKEKGWKAGDFSYNTGRLRCPVCDGTGRISLDVQFLPDVEIACPSCHGARYSEEAGRVRRVPKHKKGEAEGKAFSLPELMAMTIDEALAATGDLPRVTGRLAALSALGIGYLALGEATPGLSGGEAQRLKLAGETTRAQDGTLFVFDEPTIGLHPEDVRTLLAVFDTLLAQGATIVVIEHDLDVIWSADYIIDMGPGGGKEGGRIVVSGTPEEIMTAEESLTGQCLREALSARRP